MRKAQSGYVLLLMLFVLLSAGITGLDRSLGQSLGSGATGTPVFSAGQYSLQAAQQALLSYAALYPYLYGPRGAGPGHLPCPDTDVLSAMPWSSSSRDGPNPPCGSEAIPSGRLPRHVNLPGLRYVFHVEPLQRLEYQVSTDLINNPVNRSVNDRVIRGGREALPFVASIRETSVDSGLPATLVSHIPVSRQSLLPGVMRSVATWFVEQANRQRTQVCLPETQLPATSSQAQSAKVLSLVAEFAPASMPSSAPSSEDLPQSCRNNTSRATPMEDWLLEGVPIASHWFVRNGWYERIVIEAPESCTPEPENECVLVPSPGQSFGQSPGQRLGQSSGNGSDDSLHFRWETTS